MVILSPGKKLAKIVPAVPHWIMLAVELRARVRFNRFRHHAHGHGATIAASGGVGSRPRVPEKSAGRSSAKRSGPQVGTVSV